VKPTVTIALVWDHDQWFVTVTIRNRDYELPTFATISEAASFVGRWVSDRNYTWAPGTYRRIADAWLSDAECLVLHAIPHTPPSNWCSPSSV
jgi:hypothetical protein